MAEAEKQVDEITTNYNYGLITDEERSSAVIKAWEDCHQRRYPTTLTEQL